MCALCGILTDGPHWTEAGTDAGRTVPSASAHERLLDRAYRARLLNRILARYGLRVEDWAGNAYLVRGPGGRTELANNLPELWQAAESIAGRAIDPLDPELIGALAHARPVMRG